MFLLSVSSVRARARRMERGNKEPISRLPDPLPPSPLSCSSPQWPHRISGLEKVLGVRHVVWRGSHPRPRPTLPVGG